MTTQFGQHESFIADLGSAIRSHKPLPAFPPGITLHQAYSILPAVASLVCDDSRRGLKAGITNPDLQALFGLDEPLLGLLYDWGECRPGSRLPYREHSQIECELGIVLDADGHPVSISPAIEFVHLNFQRQEDFTPANIVVSSLGADRYLCGERTPWSEVDFEALRDVVIRLERDGEVLQEVSAYDSLNGPESALEWCVGEAKKRALDIVEGTLLLTGTCGSALPAGPGEYVADYGALGAVTFAVDALDEVMPG